MSGKARLLVVAASAALAALAAAAPLRAESIDRAAAKRLTLDEGDADRPAVEKALELAARSKTARRMAERFVRLGATVEISFSSAPAREGVVVLDPDLLQDTTGLAAVLVREVLTREAGRIEARRKGAGAQYDLLEDADSRAGAAEALFRLEALGPSEETPRWRRLAESTEAYKSVYLLAENRAALVSLEELADPCAAWRGRLKEMDRRRRHVATARLRDRMWRFRLERLIADRRIERARVQELYDAMAADDSFEFPTKELMIAEGEARLNSALAACGSAGAVPEALTKARPLAMGLRAELTALRSRLRSALGLERLDEAPASAPKTADGPLSFEDINTLFLKDLREHPERWADAPEAVDEEPWFLEPRRALSDPLAERLLSRISFKDRNRLVEREALELLVTRMLRSKTARRMAERFVALGENVEVSFGAIENSTVTLDGDTRTLSGIMGTTGMDGSTVAVRLNEMYFEQDAQPAYVDTLAHELLGHAAGNVEAKRAGVVDAYAFFTENEARAELLGWVVCGELGTACGDEASDEARMTLMTQSTAAFRGELLFDGGNVLLLDRGELADACGTYLSRQIELERRRKHVAVRDRELKVWDWRLAHAVSAHGIDPRSLEDMRDGVAYATTTILPGRTTTLDTAQPRLKERLDFCATPEGRSWSALLASQSTNPYLAVAAGSARELRERFVSLRKARPSPPEIVDPRPVVRQLGWSDLDAIRERDRKDHPEHLLGEPETPEPVPWAKY